MRGSEGTDANKMTYTSQYFLVRQPNEEIPRRLDLIWMWLESQARF